VTAPLAAIDLGTNTVRLLVADRDPAGGLRPRLAAQTVARLGAGAAARGTLDPAAVERTLAALRAYRDRALAAGAREVLVVATAGVRQARDGEAFLARLRAEAGLRPRVASAEEEARLALLGALWGLGLPREPVGLVDVGGGSTELVVGRGADPEVVVSLPIGVVALAERFLARDPIPPADLAACAAHVAARLGTEAWPAIGPRRPARLLATAGTPVVLAALDLGLAAPDPARVRGHRLTRETIARLTGRLAALTLAERARLPNVEPGRADVLVPGALVLRLVLEGLGLEALTVADAGLREGILLDAVGWRPPEGRVVDG
jgi:exopolyphosphatase/guanosine-5'-triphosphate,3'-diphosphate pyrophosphatase